MSTDSWVTVLRQRPAVTQALRVAGVVGSLLFIINHSPALLNGEMTVSRWISAGLTYLVPFFVNLQGQLVGQRRAVSSDSDG